MQKFGLCLDLIVLSLFTTTTLGNPVSSSEVANNSNHNSSPALNNNNNNYQTNAHDVLLNSLNAYSNSYDTADNNSPPFKPSYKLPPMETNFVPLQNTVSNNNHPPSAVAFASDVNMASATSISGGTPLFMQYMPQMMQEGGVHYLQLIPTRPLIVPMSPYINAGGTPSATSYGTPEIATSNALAAIYPNLKASNAHSLPSTTVIDVQSSIPPGLQAYANSLQPYRNNFRTNRDIKSNDLSPGMSLNINEYFPVNPETPNGLYVRGRR